MRCQFEAEGFLNAYELLTQNNRHFMDQAASGKNSGARQTLRADVVCLAFSLELFLKDLHFALNRGKVGGHRIIELFNELPEEIQLEIVEHHTCKNGSLFFGSLAKSPLDKFKTKLDEINNSFVKWRYSHEFSTLRYDIGFVTELIEVIKKIVCRIDAKNVDRRTA